MKLLLPLLILTACALPAPGQTIRHIGIVGIERTHAQVIERELLFAVGTQLDSSLLAESERNLRRLPYLGRADILLERDGQHVDVTVHVRDLYSRALSPLISGTKGELSYGLVGLDYNLGGRGQSLRLALENRAISGKRDEMTFRERRLFGTRQELSSRLAFGDEGHELLLAWGRPFATLNARRAYGASFFDYSTITRLYSGQTRVERYEHSRRTARVWYALGRGKEYKIRPALQLRYSEDRFPPSPPYQYAPENRRRLLTSLQLTLWRPRSAQSRFIADLGPVEDLQTGSWLTIGSGYAIPLMRGDRRYTFYSLRLSPRFQPPNAALYVRRSLPACVTNEANCATCSMERRS